MVSPIEARLYSPLQAVALLEPVYGGSTKELIAGKLKDGTIRAFAKRMWNSSRPTLNAVWLSADSDSADAELDVLVEKSVWRSGRFWHEDLGNWRWDDARAVVTFRKNSPADRTIIDGLSFLAEDVDALIPALKNRGGKTPEYQGWGEAICILIELHSAGKLTKADWRSQTKLADHLEQQLSSPNGRPLLLSETLRKALSPVWKRFVDTSDAAE